MIKEIELKNWAEYTWPILTDVNITITNLRIIYRERKNKLHLMEHGFFRYMWSQQRFILIIQLAKLFTDKKSQKQNFIKLCKRFEKETLDKAINTLLDENKNKMTDVFRSRQDILNKIKEIKISLQKHKDLIKNIEVARNKIYAHTESNITLPKMKHEELDELVLLANEIYNTLYGSIFDRYFDLERTSDWDLRFVIKKITHQPNSLKVSKPFIG
jgi:hypothetical protein